MATTELTADNFTRTVTGHDTVLVDFWAPWCGPCRMFAPIFEKASEAHPDVLFAKVDTEAERELATTAQITSIPTLMAFRKGHLVYSRPGALPAATLEALVEGLLALDPDAEPARRAS